MDNEQKNDLTSGGLTSPVEPKQAPEKPAFRPQETPTQPAHAAQQPLPAQPARQAIQQAPQKPFEQPKPKPAEEPLLPSGEDVKRFLTRGRVVGAIAILLIVSFAIDRFPANAPQTTNESDSNKNLALIAANAPGPSAANATPGMVTVYFNNGLLDAAMACDKVFPVRRQVSDVSPETALKLLLVGPTAQEANEGYFTSISPGVQVSDVSIENDVAVADFDEHLAYNLQTGSCRAQAVRAQIRETLKQFTGVTNAEILIDGNEENVFSQ
jgi:hypothetical protein